MGIHVALRKSAPLTIHTLANALLHHSKPAIFHSDSNPGCPWENGYQESFYDKFKVDFGDLNRFKTLGAVNYEIRSFRYNESNLGLVDHWSLKTETRCIIFSALQLFH